METFYSRWGCLEVYFGWMGLGEHIFCKLARIGRCIFSMDVGKWRYILCEWLLLMGGWGLMGVFLR